MITKEDVDRPGTIEHGGMTITGQVLAVDEENELFTFNTAQFGSIRLDSNQWAFLPPPPEKPKPGWYETVDAPVSTGGAPWWIDSNQWAHSFFLDADGFAEKVSFDLTGRLDIIATLRPLEQ